MTPPLRKVSLTAHIACSVGWIGAVASFLALSLIGLSTRDPEQVRAAYLAMDQLSWFIIVPLSLAALVTGLVQALGTEWGVFRYYWVMAKLFLTVVSTIILLMKLPLIGYAADEAAHSPLPSAGLQFAGMQLMVHAAGGILVLLAITTISIFKPWGKTPYGGIGATDKTSMLVNPLDPFHVGMAAKFLTSRKRVIMAFVLALIGFVVLHLLVFHLLGHSIGIHGR